MTKRELLKTLTEWPFLLQHLSALKERAASHSYSVTACYNSVGGSTPSGSTTSKVERYYIVQAELNEEIQELRNKVICILSAITKARLTNRERLLIDWLMDGRSLSSFAREKKIYKSSVYKIRDRAIAKVHRGFQTTDNTL